MSNIQIPTTQHAVLIREFGEPEVMNYETVSPFQLWLMSKS
ncbi:hypothetical protein [Psychrobacter immobilis]|nr:hypothetical protein [Psychrobacter immobilis]